ncbi:Hypothetical predicted protein [Prunus dulcis]|uniref:Uncharacterized protein n=1 Tax=Prunus dulcis TaxID=3755 RepID=A0A5E4FD17_PRUDU|nr:Hypothetical predicted protein [Prunus dulcis]
MELPSQSEYHSDSVANPDGLVGGFISHIVGDIMTSKLRLVGAWDAGFRERKSVSESSERQRSRGRKKCGTTEGKSATFEP